MPSAGSPAARAFLISALRVLDHSAGDGLLQADGKSQCLGLPRFGENGILRTGLLVMTVAWSACG